LVYNRTTAKAQQLRDEVGSDKVIVVESVEEITKRSNILITNLANDQVVETIYAKIEAALKADTTSSKSTIVVETSTIYPTLGGKLDERLSAIPSVHFVGCPIFGAPPAADKAHLILVMAGEYLAKKEVSWLLVPVMGRKIVDLGGNVEKAYTLKLIGNSFILSNLEVIAESMTLADKSGVGADHLFTIIKEMFPSPTIVNYSKKILNDEFDGSKGFAIDGGLKDAGHMRRLAYDHNSPMPVVDAAYRNMLTARAIHQAQKAASLAQDTPPPKHEVLDWSALVAGVRVSAGLPGLLDSSAESSHGRVVQEE